MNWLLALLAFAGLMAIFSTIVSISVEAVHKVLSLRRQGLEEMLRALHDGVVVDIEKGRQPRREVLHARGRSKEAADFAKAVTSVPSYGGGGRWWWPANWGLNLFQRRFERLTRRQFAEQMAATDFGERLAFKDRSQIRQAMSRLSYEFDRYGVAQSHFFRRRAKVIAGLSAFLFVTLANVNAIDLYMHLANDPEALNRTLSFVSSDDRTQLESRGAAVTARLETAFDDVAEAADGELNDADLTALREASVQINAVLDTMRASTQLPMGHDLFPFCERPSADIERCGPAQAPRLFGVVVLPTWLPDWSERLISDPAEGIVWLLSMIATAGLLALGAPFWYRLFGNLAAMIGSTASLRVGGGESEADAEQRPARLGKRGGEDPDIEELTDSFLIAAGVAPTAHAETRPIGQRLGQASREATGVAGADRAEATGAGPEPSDAAGLRGAIRRVRGDWSGRA